MYNAMMYDIGYCPQRHDRCRLHVIYVGSTPGVESHSFRVAARSALTVYIEGRDASIFSGQGEDIRVSASRRLWRDCFMLLIWPFHVRNI